MQAFRVGGASTHRGGRRRWYLGRKQAFGRGGGRGIGVAFGEGSQYWGGP